MTDKELRRLRRDDLLQILISQQRQIDELTAELEKAKDALEQRRIAVEESGSVAEAALRLNGVFEAAQAAADQYLDQIRAGAEEARAKAEAEVDKSRRVAEDIVSSARSEAERILREARSTGERIKAEAGAGVAPRPHAQAEAADDAPKPEEGRQHHGLLWRNRKA